MKAQLKKSLNKAWEKARKNKSLISKKNKIGWDNGLNCWKKDQMVCLAICNQNKKS